MIIPILIYGIESYLYLKIENTRRYYYMKYIGDYQNNYFYGSLLDYNLNLDDDDPDSPYEYINYHFSTLKI
jgi:hypothetical protein